MQKMNLEDRIALTRAVVGLLDSWGLGAAEQIALLALPEGTRPGAVRQYRQSTPFPESEQLMERIEHLIGIADALRTSYPHNAHMGNIWMNQRQSPFRQSHAAAGDAGGRAGRHHRGAHAPRLCL